MYTCLAKFGYICIEKKLYTIINELKINNMSRKSRTFILTMERLLIAAHKILGREDTSSTSLRRFKAVFGISPDLALLVWNDNMPHPFGATPKHLLWALLFLKLYSSESTHAILANCDEKTFRKWSWVFVKLISQSSKVRIALTLDFSFIFLCIDCLGKQISWIAF